MQNGYRHEFKYLISKSGAEILRRRLPHIMQRDPHAGKRDSIPYEACISTIFQTARWRKSFRV